MSNWMYVTLTKSSLLYTPGHILSSPTLVSHHFFQGGDVWVPRPPPSKRWVDFCFANGEPWHLKTFWIRRNCGRGDQDILFLESFDRDATKDDPEYYSEAYVQHCLNYLQKVYLHFSYRFRSCCQMLMPKNCSGKAHFEWTSNSLQTNVCSRHLMAH